MTIKHWPESERPQEKLLRCGAKSLSDAELLALFIRSGTPGRTAIDIGRDLLNEFGGLRQILTADRRHLYRISGCGPARYALLHASLELNRRFLDQTLRKHGPLNSPQQAADFLTHQLRDLKREVFAVLYLDTRHQVIDYEELFCGTLNGATVHPREVVRSVIEHNASAVILAHNHPSGVAEPSQSDAILTRRLRESLGLIDVRLLDHLVIGDGECVSMSDRGYLD
ncbi:MAG: RadC family protein [bacterium]